MILKKIVGNKKLGLFLISATALGLVGCDNSKANESQFMYPYGNYQYVHIQIPGTDYVKHDKILEIKFYANYVEIKGENLGYFVLPDTAFFISSTSPNACDLCGQVF